jgi:hypothetical protein
MIEIDFQPWIDQVCGHPGLLACAVKGGQATSIKSNDAAFPEKKIKELLVALAETTLTLKQDHLTGGRWRWIFENGQIHSARRADGTIAVIILTNDPAMGAIADSVLHEFVTMPGFEDLPEESATPEAEAVGVPADAAPEAEPVGAPSENGAHEPEFPEADPGSQ